MHVATSPSGSFGRATQLERVDRGVRLSAVQPIRGPSFCPWFNPKFIAQYTLYTEFNGAARNYDGSGRRASDNNTLNVAAWFAF